MIYVVLGMHKSGTTLVSKLLHRSGINMIETPDNGLSYEEGNTFERDATKRLNNEILGSHGVSSLDAICLPDITLSSELRQHMRAVVDGCGAAYDDWGFKDPRTCLTYPLWKEVLPDHKLIIVYRGLGEVQRHYLGRDWRRKMLHTFSISWKAVRTWSTYNARILEYVRASDVPYLALNYAELMANDAELVRLAGFLNRDIEDVRDVRHYRHRIDCGWLVDLMGVLQSLKAPMHPRDVFRELERLR